MKNQLFYLAIILFPCLSKAQNVGIGTVSPQAKLEVRNASRSDVKIRTNNYTDTTKLIFSNRDGTEAGTDFNISSRAESGLVISSASDLTANTHDSIMKLTPNGRVGINNSTPLERLDVGGNINLSGTIKANGVDGTAGQVLMKNSSGAFEWGDGSQYKNLVGFKAGSSSFSNTLYTWTIPASVTKIIVEAWAGGGGGAYGGGGGGGGYAATEWVVIPGATVNITVGASGLGAASSSTNGGNGAHTIVDISSLQLVALGGEGGQLANGGYPGRFSTNTGSLRIYGQSGVAGEATQDMYGQYNATVFYTALRFGSGGQGGNTQLAQKNGGFYSFNNSTLLPIKTLYGQIGSEPGGGGGGSSTGGGYGGPGLVIIHY